MVTLSPKVLGFVRSVVYVAITGAAMYLLHFVSDPANLNGLLNPSLAVLIAGLAGTVEHQMESNGSGALFGVAAPRG